MVPQYRVVLYTAFLLLAVTVVWQPSAILGVAAMKGMNKQNQNGIMGTVRQQYYAPLSKTSQGLAGAVLGFTGARVLVNSASTVVKVAGVAFLAYVTVNEYVLFFFLFENNKVLSHGIPVVMCVLSSPKIFKNMKGRKFWMPVVSSIIVCRKNDLTPHCCRENNTTGSRLPTDGLYNRCTIFGPAYDDHTAG